MLCYSFYLKNVTGWLQVVLFVIWLEKYLNGVEIFYLDHFALEAEQKCSVFLFCFDILRPVVTCLPCAGCLRWQEAAWLIKAWTALQTPLTHSWYCHEHHSYNTLVQESFPSVSPDVRARARAGERLADLCACGHAQFHYFPLRIDSSR